MKVDTNWYWDQQPKHYVITVIKLTIIHPQLKVNTVTYFHAIPTSVCTRKQAKKATSIQPVCLTDSDYDYVLEEIGRQEKLSLKEV